ncbi:BQ2448_501 [Microbotryum intermedium]|uniref:BQ2448_501 protein n=1 Tax=Microbotryum intermedium TaxID=269621 RepID=A0A238F2M3_9BASI|nr:BQ2448_501 [Microbotryum intermedium]
MRFAVVCSILLGALVSAAPIASPALVPVAALALASSVDASELLSRSEVEERSNDQKDLEKRAKLTLAAGKTTYKGQATWYTQDGNAGSCGKYNSDSAIIVAVNTPQVNGGSHCGRYVTILNTSNKKIIRAKVADECPGCGYGSLDLSTAAFKKLGNLDTGVLPIKWQWS